MSSPTTTMNGHLEDLPVTQVASPPTAATKLRHIIEDPNAFLMCPGVYDGFSARIALQVGFDGLYMTGAGSTASLLGHADLGLLSLPEMRTHASNLASLSPTTPLIADADTGYGGPIMVARTVTQYAAAGVAGLHIEDQVQTKRCGHLAGKELVDKEVYVSRIRAAVQSRKRIGSDIVIIARTDALQKYGYEEAVARLRAARDAGADVAFLEGVTSRHQAKQALKDLYPTPSLLNMVEHGATPSISAQEAKEMGFKLITFPFAALAPAYGAIKAGMEKLKQDGCMDSDKSMTPQMLFRVCGLEESMRIDREAGGASFDGGVD